MRRPVSRALTQLARHPLMMGLGPGHHPSPNEGGGGPPAVADPGLKSFFEATLDPMLLYGPDLVIVVSNAAASRLMRMPDDQLRGRSVLEVALLARILGAASVPQRLRGTTSVVRDEVTVADAEGQPIQCQVEALQLSDGRVLLHLQDTTPALRARSVNAGVRSPLFAIEAVLESPRSLSPERRDRRHRGLRVRIGLPGSRRSHDLVRS